MRQPDVIRNNYRSPYANHWSFIVLTVSLSRSLIATFVLALASGLSMVVGAQTTPAGKWTAERTETGMRSLSYDATVPVLGKPTRVTVSFYCDTFTSKMVHGALGFDLFVDKVAALKPFRFDDFEGPDALSNGKKLMRVSIIRPGKPTYTVNVNPSGSTPAEGNFVFGVMEVSKLAKSTPRTMLQMLADGAERFEITITDTKNPKLKLEIVVPVAGKEADFKTLMTGLK
ncbi:MAG: hypothetical protein EAZ30_16645 [Betaproteobacteria bacterium]|nr:MAG: hypothetical protein EAZ30_16645 [Betaproteobacteria bacterium]